jgi:hypothetical protein
MRTKRTKLESAFWTHFLATTFCELAAKEVRIKPFALTLIRVCSHLVRSDKRRAARLILFFRLIRKGFMCERVRKENYVTEDYA